jgi:anti-anti-sigma regulatory factor
MKSEALDITIVSRGSSLWLLLSGPFHNEQVPNIKEKITGLIDDGNRRLVINMENVSDVADSVAPMFLTLVNLIKGKGGDIKFVFKNEPVSRAFSPYRNLFSIYPDALALNTGGFFGILRRRRSVLSKKTGVRMSRPVAFILLVSLGGWFLSLVFIILIQNQRIRHQEMEVIALSRWKQQAGVEVVRLRERIRPLDQLGILKDTAETHGRK